MFLRLNQLDGQKGHIEARYNLYQSKMESIVIFDNWLTREQKKS